MVSFNLGKATVVFTPEAYVNQEIVREIALAIGGIVAEKVGEIDESGKEE